VFDLLIDVISGFEITARPAGSLKNNFTFTANTALVLGFCPMAVVSIFVISGTIFVGSTQI
jgi:hypothetical protein